MLLMLFRINLSVEKLYLQISDWKAFTSVMEELFENLGSFSSPLLRGFSSRVFMESGDGSVSAQAIAETILSKKSCLAFLLD